MGKYSFHVVNEVILSCMLSSYKYVLITIDKSLTLSLVHYLCVCLCVCVCCACVVLHQEFGCRLSTVKF